MKMRLEMDYMEAYMRTLKRREREEGERLIHNLTIELGREPANFEIVAAALAQREWEAADREGTEQ